MKTLKKILCAALVLAMVLTMMPTSVDAAKKKAPKLNKTKLTLRVGKSATLKVKNTKKKVKWSSSKKSVATVSKKGKVKAKKVGKATITAKVAKKKLKCKVTVKAKKATKTPKPTPAPVIDNTNVVTAVQIAGFQVINPKTLHVTLSSAQALTAANFSIMGKVNHSGTYLKTLPIKSVTTVDQITYVIGLDSNEFIMWEDCSVQVTVTGLQGTGTALAESVYKREARAYTEDVFFTATAGEEFEYTNYPSFLGSVSIQSKNLPAGVDCALVYENGVEVIQYFGNITTTGKTTGQIVYKDEFDNTYTINLTWVVGNEQTLSATCNTTCGVYGLDSQRYGEKVYIAGGSGEYLLSVEDDSLEFDYSDDTIFARVSGPGKKDIPISVKDANNPELQTTFVWTQDFVQGKDVKINIEDMAGNAICNLDNINPRINCHNSDLPYGKHELVVDRTADDRYVVWLIEGYTYDIEVDRFGTTGGIYDVTVANTTTSVNVTMPLQNVTLTHESLDLSNAIWYRQNGNIAGNGSELYLPKGNHLLKGFAYDATSKYELQVKVTITDAGLITTPTIIDETELCEGTITTATGAAVVMKEEYTYYQFVPEESGNYFFYSEIEDAHEGDEDSYGILMDEAMNVLVENDDYDSDSMGYNFGFVYECEIGKTYYVGIKALGPKEIGLNAVVYVQKEVIAEE